MELVQNEHIKNITNILKNIGERIEGNLICDISPENYVYNTNIAKIRNLQYLCKGKQKIMEIGINACHSLIIMLLENPDAEYLLFDLNNHKYTVPTLEYIKHAFPNTKINVIFGNSVNTISEYISNNPSEINTYDLIHLDGGHTQNIFSHDYNNSKILLKDNGIVIFDDYNMNEIKQFINMKLKQLEICPINDNHLLETHLHFVYKYL